VWVIVLGEHFVYIDEKETRFETKSYFLATLVYWLYYVRYVFSIYPEKYVKIYRIENGVAQLGTYQLIYQGRRRDEIKRHKNTREAFRKLQK
jgi:hypothetical protein